jgi:hypothetical protein
LRRSARKPPVLTTRPAIDPIGREYSSTAI